MSDMEKFLIEKQKQARRAIFGDSDVVQRKGYADTSAGLVLTTNTAMEAARKSATNFHAKKVASAKKLAEKKHREHLKVLRSERAR